MPSPTVLFVVAGISIVSLFAWVGLVWKNVQTSWEATAAERAKYAKMAPSDVLTGVSAPTPEAEKSELVPKAKGKKKPGKKKPVAKADEAATESASSDESKPGAPEDASEEPAADDESSKKEA
jgi:hypothetical protein